MPPGDIIIIKGPKRVRSSFSQAETITRLRAAADLLESGNAKFSENDINVSADEEDDDED